MCAFRTTLPLLVGSVKLRLAWQSAFRTFDWAKAIGDLETTSKEIKYLMSLV